MKNLNFLKNWCLGNSEHVKTRLKPGNNQVKTTFRFIALLTMLFSLGINNAWADSWTKVTAEPASWAGEYLLIRETSSTAGKAWTGVDAASCQVDATISSGTISSTPTGAVTLTITAVTGGYSIKVNGGTNNGKYIYGTSGSNVINFNASAQVNTISYDGTNKCADIVSNTSHIRYNTNRFRYYKSSTYTSSSVVQLYKKDADCSNKVTLTKGSPSNGSFSLNKSDGSYDNCDNNFEVVVSSITPNSGYVFDEITVSGAAGKHSITGPDGSGNYTVSYTKGNSITSTINVTFKQACATPTFTNGTGTYNNDVTETISCATGGATIHYTSGASPSDPTCSTETTGTSVTISSTGTVLKAIACKDGLDPSSVASATYTLKCATPTFSPVAAVYKTTQSVTLSCGTTSAVIHYTTDGSTPTGSSPTYSSAISVSSTTTIKAIAVKSGYQDSEVATATYTIMDCDWYESFDDCAGTGGNSGGFSGVSSYGTGTKVVDNSGWTWTNTSTGGGDKCVKLGTSSKQGAAQTPTITVDNGVTGRVSFKMAPWDSGTAHIELSGAKITGSVNTTTWDAASAMTSGAWNNYEVDITTTGTSLKITFNSSGYRCWLDEVCVKMEPASYTVSFDANGHGIAPSDITDVAKNSTINSSKPSDPSATGWTFGGWYKEEGCTNAWNWATDQVTSDITLYAKWTCVAPTTATVSATGSKWDYCAGESMTLTAGGTGIGDGATYLWKVSHDGGSSYSNAPGTNNASTYSVASMTLAHGGKYTCTISNGSCSTTSSAYDVKVWCVHINNGAAGAYQDIAFTNTGTGTGTANVALDADQSYGFKLWNNNGASIGWYGLDSKTITTTESNITLNSSGANVGINAGLGGTYVFTIDYTSATSPKVNVTYPTGNQPSGRKIWFDKSVITGWTDAGTSDLVWRIGKSNNSMTNEDNPNANAFTLVAGTDRFYEYTTKEYNGFDAWHVANNTSWSGTSDGTGERGIYYHYHNQASTDVTRAIVYQKYVIGTSGVTLVPTTKKNTDYGCDFWYVSKTDGMLTHTATITTPSHGTITIANAAQSLNATSTTADLPHRTILTVTATPATGYNLTSLTVNEAAFTSGNTHILAADATIAAAFTAKVITVTWNVNGGNALVPGTSSYTYDGDALVLPTPTKDGKVFAGWYTLAEGGVEVTNVGGANKPTADVEYFAHWSDGNRVVFHPGAGTVSPDVVTQETVGGSVTLSTPSPTCDGWTFQGWKVGSEQTDVTELPDGLLAGGSSYVPASATVDMYAVYKKTFEETTPVTRTYSWDGTVNAYWTISPNDVTRITSDGTYKNSGQLSGDHSFTFNSKVKVKSVSFKFLRSSNNTTGSLWICKSTTNTAGSWDDTGVCGVRDFSMPSSKDEFQTYQSTNTDFDGETEYYVRIEYFASGSSATRYVDDISVTYNDVTSVTHYATSPTECSQVATPVISPEGDDYIGAQSITITCATAGATIKYTTDGTDPSSSNGTTIASGSSFTLSCSGTVKAIAYKAGMDDSNIASETYTLTVPNPTFSPDGGDFKAAQSVSISDALAGTTIYYEYTTDGSEPSDPTASSTAYSSTIPVAVGQTVRIKAIGINACCTNSAIVSKTFRVGWDFELVTNEDDLNAGDKIVVLSGTTAAMSTYNPAGNNRTSSSDFDIDGTTVTAYPPSTNSSTTVQVITLAGEPGAWKLVTSATQWLNCPSAGKLTTVTTDGSGAEDLARRRWSIDIGAGDTYYATIQNNQETTATIQYGTVFAAYATSQSPVKIYSLPNPEPVIKVESSLTAFASCAGNAGTYQSFYISGKNLDAAIVISGPAGYEFCLTSDGTYTNTLNLTPVSKTVAKTQVYVRLAASATAGAHNGNLNAAVSVNSLSTNIAVTGSASTADTYIDRVHNTTTTYECGSYSAPSCPDESPSTGSCTATHYKFMGWVTAANIASGLANDDAYKAVIVTAGTAMTASGTTYYAVWAEEE